MESLLFENGFVYLPTEADWLASYARDLTTFPGSKYDGPSRPDIPGA